VTIPVTLLLDVIDVSTAIKLSDSKLLPIVVLLFYSIDARLQLLTTTI